MRNARMVRVCACECVRARMCMCACMIIATLSRGVAELLLYLLW